jgi:ferredoxin
MERIDQTGLAQLLDAIASRGYALTGPTVREGGIVFDAIRGIEDLPKGIGDDQGPASYRLRTRDDGAYFGFVMGPVSWKKFLFPPRVTLFSAVRSGKAFAVAPAENAAPPRSLALIGVRPCEVNAIQIQDRVFLNGNDVESGYKAIREACFIVAVNCTEPGGNCFCASMKTGPRAQGGFDVVLTEVIGDGHHFFLAESGTARGAEVLDAVPHQAATGAEESEAAAALARAAESQEKRMNTQDLPRILKDNFEHPEWDDVAKRCLACANCTMVCPTCFCSTVEDVTDLSGTKAERRRRWDSCFTAEFTRVAGGNVRPSVRARYRQWLTHKLQHWVDQFGTMGCVGCGRCITWCPAGIDITAEAAAIRGNGTQAQGAGNAH